MNAAVLAAVTDPNNPDWGKAGPIALFVLLAFFGVCYFLFRSMIRQMKKVPPSFDKADASSDGPIEPAAAARTQRRGLASPAIPPRVSDDSYVASGAPRPKLGTPDDLVVEEKAKRQERIRKAKQRRARS